MLFSGRWGGVVESSADRPQIRGPSGTQAPVLRLHSSRPKNRRAERKNALRTYLGTALCITPSSRFGRNGNIPHLRQPVWSPMDPLAAEGAYTHYLCALPLPQQTCHVTVTLCSAGVYRSVTPNCGTNCERRISVDGWISLSNSSENLGPKKVQ